MTNDIKALVERLMAGANFHEGEGDIGMPMLLRDAAAALTRMVEEKCGGCITQAEYGEAFEALERQRDEAIAALKHCEYDKGKIQRRYDKAIAALSIVPGRVTEEDRQWAIDEVRAALGGQAMNDVTIRDEILAWPARVAELEQDNERLREVLTMVVKGAKDFFSHHDRQKMDWYQAARTALEAKP